MKIISLEEENERVKSIYEDVKEKYESLRDIDSPVKEVSQMKKVLKQNDVNIERLLREKEELIKKLEISENKQKLYQEKSFDDNLTSKDREFNEIIDKLNNKIIGFDEEKMKLNAEFIKTKEKYQQETEILQNSLLDITEKYESLRDVDSPVKEVSNMKKILKQNDLLVEKLNKEKEELIKQRDT